MSGGFTPNLVERQDPLSGQINVLASQNYTMKRVGITIDSTSVAADANGNKIVPNGTILAHVESTDKYVPYAGATAEAQTIGLGSATAGTVKIKFGGKETAAIPYNATSSDVQTALEALSNIDAGDVTVTGGPFPGVLTIAFGGKYENEDVPTITATATGLTGGAVTIATTTQGGEANCVLVNGGVNLRDGDVITGGMIAGSLLRARIPNLDAAAEKSLSHIIFQ